MKQNKKKTAFLPCKIFKHDGATLTVGVSETTINDKPAPSEVYFLVEGYGNGEDDPEAVATFTPDRAVEIAEALLKFARLAKEELTPKSNIMNNEKLRKMLQAAEKYGADVAYEMAVNQDSEGDSNDNANEGAEIATFINKGTRRIIEGRDNTGNSDGSLAVDPITNLPM